MIYLQYIALAWVISTFFKTAFEKIKNVINSEFIHNLTPCHKCLTFWITLLLTANIFTASIVALGLFILTELLNLIPTKL